MAGLATGQSLGGSTDGAQSMNLAPDVSVVMSVYNGASHLEETLASVLSQEDCDFEFIVINDGSTDATGEILTAHAERDPRLRVFHQDNTGLTLALARGCAEARGEFIARQDAGDTSLPGRLSQQLAFMRSCPLAVMAAVGVRFCGPQGELLRETVMPGKVLDDGLRRLSLAEIQGPPHHGATMFRRDAYERAGGYRGAFLVAQDIDLWLRLSEQASCVGMAAVLYQARQEAGSISSRRRDEQFRAGELAIACALSRRNFGSDEPVLRNVSLPRAAVSRGEADNWERARFHYHIASCLRGHDRATANRYYRMALRDQPLYFKALLRWLIP